MQLLRHLPMPAGCAGCTGCRRPPAGPCATASTAQHLRRRLPLQRPSSRRQTRESPWSHFTTGVSQPVNAGSRLPPVTWALCCCMGLHQSCPRPCTDPKHTSAAGHICAMAWQHDSGHDNEQLLACLFIDQCKAGPWSAVSRCSSTSCNMQRPCCKRGSCMRSTNLSSRVLVTAQDWHMPAGVRKTSLGTHLASGSTMLHQ